VLTVHQQVKSQGDYACTPPACFHGVDKTANNVLFDRLFVYLMNYIHSSLRSLAARWARAGTRTSGVPQLSSRQTLHHARVYVLLPAYVRDRA
jgi:hypothetical protein